MIIVKPISEVLEAQFVLGMGAVHPDPFAFYAISLLQ
jgi:hypothetical protein